MKKIFFSVSCVLMFVAIANAGPYLVCDPQEGVTSYNVTGQTFTDVIQPAQADGSIRMDVANAPNGDTALVINACKDDSTWGRLCSTTVPFTLSRPAPPSAPKAPRLVP